MAMYYINLSLIHFHQTLKYDISLGTEHYYKIVEDVQALINSSPEFNAEEKTQIQVTGYGHIADGNLHLNIAIPGYDNITL